MQQNKNHKRVFLVSNMYPSKENPRYGIFVNNFEKAICENFKVEKVVLFKKNRFFKKMIGYILLYTQIFRLLFKATPNDIIYVHYPLHMAPVLYILLVFKKKIILNFHGSDLVFDNFFKKTLAIFLTPLVKRGLIVVPSEYYKEKIIRQFNLQKEKVEILVYPSGGINMHIFHPLKSKNQPSTFTIGYVSNFIEEKGWKIFLEAVKILNNNNTILKQKIIMVGDGPDETKIKALINEYKLEVSLYSKLSQGQLAKIYNSLNLFIFPSYREAESLGLVGLEAMACGVPIIASKVGGPMGYVKQGMNGYLCNKEDSAGFANKIKEYYNLSLPNKKQMQLNALETASQYENTLVNKKMISFLNKA